MSKAPRTVARIKSTGVFGDFPAAVLAAVEHDTYILESEAATALAEARAEIARLEALALEAKDALRSTGNAWPLEVAKKIETVLSQRGGGGVMDELRKIGNQDEAHARADRLEAALRGLMEIIDSGSVNEPQVISARAALSQGKGEGV